MPFDVQCRAIQFLSPLAESRLRNEKVHGVAQWRARHEFAARFVLSKGDPTRRPAFAQPWPQLPTIGALEYVDRYADRRWPMFLEGGACLSLEQVPTTYDAWLAIAEGVRHVLFKSFRTMNVLAKLPGETIVAPGYRRQYVTTAADLAGSPVPSPEPRYQPSVVGEPVGPGFVTMPADFVESGGRHTSLNIVWSQAFSLANVTSPSVDMPRITKRVDQLRSHWNSYNELRDANRYAKGGDVKGATRSAASAVDAAIRFYADEWGVSFPNKRGMSFMERVDNILLRAGRTAFSVAELSASQTLAHAYSARSSMHRGDHAYKNSAGNRVEVRITEAREFVAASELFTLWIDSQA
jgi:hypothetical protein